MVSGADLFLGLLNNLVVLILLVAVYGAQISRLETLAWLPRQSIMGVTFGLFAIICMYVKIPVADGVIVDQRNVIVALSGAFGGPVSALISAAFAGAYRIHLGGAGALGGTIGVMLAATAGSCMYRFPQYQNNLLFLLVTSFLAAAFIMPGFLFFGDLQTGWNLMVAMTPPFGSAVMIGILMGSYLLSRENRRRRIERERIVADQKRVEAYHELMRANRAKSQFLAVMSHELRTPLNAILGSSDLLQLQGPAALPEEKRLEYAEHIHTSGQHLLSLINDILDISTIEAGKRNLQKRPFVLNGVLTACINNFINDPNIGPVTIGLEADDEIITINADERAVAQIVLNLLSNAIKFSPDSKAITVKVHATPETVTIIVSDQGIGIPSDQLDTITEPFSRLATHAHITQEGTGLGLSIVKSLIELHGGELHIASKLGNGTDITVTLPRLDQEIPKRRSTDRV